MEANLSNEALRAALQAWPLPEPVTIRPLPGGMTGEVWQIEAGPQHFVAKYAYMTQQAFEGGLYAAELVEQHNISCGIPLRTKHGTLSIMVMGTRGQSQPLALLYYIPGERLNLDESSAPALYGYLLGRTRSILLTELGDWCSSDLYDFLLAEDPSVTAQPNLAPLIHLSIEAARVYEARRAVTYGVIWADALEIRRDSKSGRTGIIDWGAIERGPLLFDVALNVLWHFPEGSQAHGEFMSAYLSESPISVSELEGIKYYKALIWARQTKFYAYCVAENVTLGGSTPTSNAENLKQSRQELESSLANL